LQSLFLRSQFFLHLDIFLRSQLLQLFLSNLHDLLPSHFLQVSLQHDLSSLHLPAAQAAVVLQHDCSAFFTQQDFFFEKCEQEVKAKRAPINKNVRIKVIIIS